ncbi:MAG: RNA polymerase sigma factor RpoD/SigA [Erysipelotrichales bacterium]|nr:RNA polymerase sigma factor RpoD/SigA [Erysipelotrichales bacterium]
MGTQIDELPNEKLYNLIVAYLEKLYGEYNYTQMDMNEFSNIAMSSIENALEKYTPKNEKELAKCIKKSSTLAIDNHIRKKMKDETVCLSFVTSYLHDKISLVNTYDEALIEFNNIVKFIRRYVVVSEILFDLIKTDEKLDKILSFIINHDKEKIVEGKSKNIFKDDVSISLIEAYCINNNIQIKETITEDELTDYIKRVEESFFEDNIKIYFQDVGRTKILSRFEEESIAYAALEGDKEALKVLAESHLRYVIKIAKGYRGQGLLFLDLIQEGNIGLIKATKKFDVRRGYRFKTYAEWLIREEIRIAIANNSRNIRIPYATFYQIEKYKRTKRGLISEIGREPTLEEIAKFMGISKRKAKNLEKLVNDTYSLNEPVDDSEENEISMFIPSEDIGPDEMTINNSLAVQVRELFKKVELTDIEALVLILRCGLDGDRPLLFREIGKIIDRTENRAQQIYEQALAKFRLFEDIKKYVDYTDNPERSVKYIDCAREQYEKTGNYYKQIVMK